MTGSVGPFSGNKAAAALCAPKLQSAASFRAVPTSIALPLGDRCARAVVGVSRRAFRL